MKNIIIISSSFRNKSNSELLAQQALQGALDAGNRAELITLKNKEIRFCKGCLACQRTMKCVIKDDDVSRQEILVIAFSSSLLCLQFLWVYKEVASLCARLVNGHCHHWELPFDLHWLISIFRSTSGWYYLLKTLEFALISSGENRDGFSAQLAVCKQGPEQHLRMWSFASSSYCDISNGDCGNICLMHLLHTGIIKLVSYLQTKPIWKK